MTAWAMIVNDPLPINVLPLVILLYPIAGSSVPALVAVRPLERFLLDGLSGDGCSPLSYQGEVGAHLLSERWREIEPHDGAPIMNIEIEACSARTAPCAVPLDHYGILLARRRPLDPAAFLIAGL